MHSCVEYLLLLRPIPIALFKTVWLMMNWILSEKLTCRFRKIRCVLQYDGSGCGGGSRSSGGGDCGPSIDGRTVETAISPTQGCFL